MWTCFIRNFFMITAAIFTFYKLLNFNFYTKYTYFRLITFAALTSLFSAKFFIVNQSINWLFLLLCFIFIFKIKTKINSSTIYTTSLFSFALSFISFILSTSITIFIFSIFYYNKYQLPLLLMHTTAGILQVLLIYLCFSIPRLRKGMTFLYDIPSWNMGLSICFFVFILIFTFGKSKTPVESFTLKIVTGTFMLAFLLIYWWNYHITQTYRKYLKKNEIDSLNLLLEERNQEIAYLKSENDKLSRIIHKDNKLLPAISMAIMESGSNNAKLDLSGIATDSPLNMKLKQLYEEREEIVTTYEKERIHLPETSFPSINAVLSYMQSEALKHHIPYQVMLFDDLSDTIPKKISENDFIHLLSDLLANAINACKNTDSGIIQIYLGNIDGIFTIKICNTESIFNIETLKVLGLTRHTTHADSGGSGIGLMDIWMLKEKYKATLLIDEITDSPSGTYTCINILFNHKNHFIIQSDRYKKLTLCINRPDVIILSKECISP